MSHFLRNPRTRSALLGLLTLTSPSAALTTLDFSGLPNGSTVTTPINGVTLTATSPNQDASDRVRVVQYTQSTRPADEGHRVPFNHGNIANPDDLGYGLVLAGLPGRFFETRADPGSIALDFATPITALSFAVADHEMDLDDISDTFIQLYNRGEQVAALSDDAFVTRGSGVFDPSIRFGINTANRIAPLTSAQFGADSFDRAVITLSGSASIADIRYEPVPTPTAALAGLTLMSLTMLRRRRAASV